MHGNGPCVVFERAGLIDLAFLKGGHHLFVVNQQTYFVFFFPTNILRIGKVPCGSREWLLPPPRTPNPESRDAVRIGTGLWLYRREERP